MCPSDLDTKVIEPENKNNNPYIAIQGKVVVIKEALVLLKYIWILGSIVGLGAFIWWVSAGVAKEVAKSSTIIEKAIFVVEWALGGSILLKGIGHIVTQTREKKAAEIASIPENQDFNNLIDSVSIIPCDVLHSSVMLVCILSIMITVPLISHVIVEYVENRPRKGRRDEFKKLK